MPVGFLNDRLDGTSIAREPGVSAGAVPTPSFRIGTSSDRGVGVFAAHAVPAGTDLLPIIGTETTEPDKHTVQIAENLHISGGDASWTRLNHACTPNCLVDLDRRWVRAVRPIKKGEELTFNYLTTEWLLRAPFFCGCEQPHCPGDIKGLSELADAHLAPIRHLVHPPLLRRRLASAIAIATT
jgi:hypothetical protein